MQKLKLLYRGLDQKQRIRGAVQPRVKTKKHRRKIGIQHPRNARIKHNLYRMINKFQMMLPRSFRIKKRRSSLVYKLTNHLAIQISIMEEVLVELAIKENLSVLSTTQTRETRTRNHKDQINQRK